MKPSVRSLHRRAGSASFVKPAGKPPQWEGDLSVRVPGGGHPRSPAPTSTGPCRLHAIDELADCATRLEELKRLALNALDLAEHAVPAAMRPPAD
jgi:hypothetical protein